MNELFERETWIAREGETALQFHKRKELQTQHLYKLRRARGSLYMVKFGEDPTTGAFDVRPMWEDNISIPMLRQEIKGPMGMAYDCPLCQPYDSDHLGRRYMCRIADPRYEDGFIDSLGVWAKCPCLDQPKKRQYHKFKK